ncbi:hypothetical protein [Amycolatopsis sp. MtRt-6]|uniref:hypothetical protein n=1 Tax=Amycolatopsis sp. MtRt-6 TaxID=2792782 RepID=UPI001F5C0CB5|nr:hypothetical protein [Amycolatopsis sp. MtRt-6]
MLTDLTEVERQVVDAARRGEAVKPATTMTAEELAVTDDAELRVRADLLRELLRGLRGDLDPRGIRIVGVRVVGELDLDHVTAVTGLHLYQCALPDGVSCRYARLRDLYLDGSLLTYLRADGLRTDSNLFVRDATITDTRKNGAIRLIGAHIGGQAVLLMSSLDNSSGPLLVMHEAQVTGALFPPTSLVCPAGRQEVGRRGCPDRDRTITAHGLTFPILRETSWRQWLHLLVHHTPTYWPQPFQQLAATERAAGHDNNAREVLITQQHELRRRTPQALGNRFARGRHALWGRLGRYGYRAHRLVTALAVVLTLAAGLGLLAGHVTTRPGHHAAERVPPATAKPGAPGTPCSPVELIGLGIDRGLPLGATGIRAHCDLDTATAWGQTFTAVLWALQALLWGLATLAIAAYTGLVRKPT